MVCEECGAKNESGSNFCWKCGKKICDLCNCWVLNHPYNCRHTMCPGRELIEKNAQDKQKIEE